jgi:hypothetical protein
MTDTPPFKRDEFLDEPGIVGARWWQEGLVHTSPVSRRAAIQALLVGGGLLTFGLVVSKSSSCGPDKSTVEKSSLDMQKQYGWDFGARGESLTWNGAAAEPFQPGALASLSNDLTPVRAELRPYFIPTLLQSLTMAPTSTVEGETRPFVPLRDVLRPIHTVQMDAAYHRGKALADLFAAISPPLKDVAVVVDLPGPESVAFAAGAAAVFDPVFAIDNWPHPKGVVPAHQTLAAAAYYQPLFAKAAAARPSSAPPLFVLDRARLSAYADDQAQFDNRHVARLPPADRLLSLGVKHVLYVAPTVSDVPELDDLNDDFALDAVSGLDIKIVGADAFGPELKGPGTAPTWAAPLGSTPASSADDPSAYYYGWRRATNASFWVDYATFGGGGGKTSAASAVPPSNVPTAGRDYVPRARVSPFSSGNPTGTTRTLPPSFGVVTVEVAAATGLVLAVLFGRSGSWSRGSSGSWGSGFWGGG